MPQDLPQLICKKLVSLSLGIAFWVQTPSLDANSDLLNLSYTEDIRPLLEEYCYRCHGEEKQKGDVQLSSFHNKRMILKEHKLWQEVIHMVESEEMPDEEPLPTPEERALIVGWLEQTLNEIDWSKVKNPGHITMPRLTKTEYNNTMRDLLGIDIKPGNFFSEDGEGQSGFTNDRDSLFITPVLMEKYFDAAERSIDALLSFKKEPIEYHYESEDMFMTETRETPKQFGDDFWGYVINRGQMTLYESIDFPHDGFYEFTVRALSTEGPTGTRLRINDETKGDIEIYSEEPGLYQITAFVAKGSHQVAWNIQKPAVFYKPKSQPKQPAYKDFPVNAGKLVQQGVLENTPKYPTTPDDSETLSASIKRFNEAASLMQEQYEQLRLLGSKGDPEVILKYKDYVRQRNEVFKDATAELAKKLNLSVDEFRIHFRSLNSDKLAANEQILEAIAEIEPVEKIIQLKPQSVAIDWVKIRGPVRPMDAPEEPLVFIAQPDKRVSPSKAAERILRQFTPRAFRRKVSKKEIARYTALYEKAAAAGQSFDESVKLALTGVLVSPHFLYRPELAPSERDKEYRIDDYQLASRLSYFLWMSMPDEELLLLAKSNRLHRAQNLRKQVDRMLRDPRASEAMETFLGQWLGFESLGVSVIPDPRTFPKYDPPLQEAMKAETVLAFNRLIKDSGSLLQLLDSDETYLNDVLAMHYGIDGVEGSEMRLVKLTDRNRGGLLGMGSILTATSNPVRTNPVSRGKWVLETLLGNRIPEPPADAGILPENAGQVKGQTLREEFEMHRRNPSCVDCHEKIDPIGFGLENFDAIGRYRETENGKPIDSTGVMPDGVSFNGPMELKDYLLAEKQDQFIRNVCEKMLAFALGRELKHYDEAALIKIIDALEKSGYDARTLISEVVLSYPFQFQHPNPDNE
jgi:hypothetical protein